MRLHLVFPMFLAAESGMLAQDFWTVKESAEWSEGQIRKIVTGSPWAREANVSLKGSRNLPLEPRAGVPVRTPAGTAPDESRPASIPARAPADIAGDSNPAAPRIVIRWESARPVGEACAKGGMDPYLFSCVSKILYLSGIETKFIELSKEFYILSISNYPNVVNGWRATDQPQHSPAAIAAMEQMSRRIQQTAFLKRTGKSPMRPSNVITLPAGKTLLVVLFFTRAEPITLADKEVVFESDGGTIEVRSRFDLRKMVYKGRLDL